MTKPHELGIRNRILKLVYFSPAINAQLLEMHQILFTDTITSNKFEVIKQNPVNHMIYIYANKIVST